MLRARYVLPLVLLAAPPAFEPVQPDLFKEGGALANAWADYDGDGDADLFVGFGGSPANRLYRNDNGMFRDVAVEVGIADARATRAERERPLPRCDHGVGHPG
jgi:hypothetical protein